MQIKSGTNPILLRMQRELDQLRLQRRHRRLEHVHGLNFCSNDYLGLSIDVRLKLAVVGAFDLDDRVCSTGSRLLSGHAALWDEVEEKLAAFIGSEAALYFNSGYMANVGLLSSLLGPEAVVLSDSANHASIIDGIRLSRASKIVFPHRDMNYLERALAASSNATERFIVTESIFSMDGDVAPLEDIFSLAERYDAAVIVDEAHATGVAGPKGRGVVAATRRPDCLIATMHTCGKALASMGAFVACSRTLRHYLINRSRQFIFTTALAPYIAGQTMQAIKIVEGADDLRLHLATLAEHLRSQLARQGFDPAGSQSQIIPIVLGSNEYASRVAQNLCEQGFGIKAIRPPTVAPGTARLRLSLTTQLTTADLDALAEALPIACESARDSAVRSAG